MSEHFIVFLIVLYGLYFIVLTMLLGLIRKNFNFKKNTLSEFGGNKNFTGPFFNFSLFFYAALETTFIFYLLGNLSLWSNYLLLSFFSIALISGALAAFLTTKRHNKTHWTLGLTSFGCAHLGALILGVNLLKLNEPIAMFQILLTVFVGASLIKFLKRNKHLVAWQEYFFFGGLFLWNLSNAIFLAKIN